MRQFLSFKHIVTKNMAVKMCCSVTFCKSYIPNAQGGGEKTVPKSNNLTDCFLAVKHSHRIYTADFVPNVTVFNAKDNLQ